MSLTNFPYGLTSFGIPLVGDMGFPGQGKCIFLDPVNGNDGRSGLSIQDAVKTLPVAYAKTTANKNDTVFYLAGSSSISLSAQLVWSNSMTHLIGVCSPSPVAQRARIFQAAAATGLSPLIDITGSGCIFSNIYINQGVNDATSKVCVRVKGQRNAFINCHFTGINNATQDVAGAASLELGAGSAENIFKHCSIGSDTQVTRAQNSTELLFTAGAASTRNLFEDCLIYAYISNAGHRLVSISDGTAIDRWNIFKNCLFITDSLNRGVTATEVFLTPAGIVQGKIILQDCMMLTDGASGSGVWDASGAAVIWANMGAPTAAAAGGIATKL